MGNIFYSDENIIDRLVHEYHTQDEFYIGFDFDDTILGYHQNGYENIKLINLLKRANEKGLTLILFTVREGVYQEEALKYLESVEIYPKYVNENPYINSKKPFFNILLDDRCGLEQSVRCLEQFLKTIDK